MKDEKKPKGTVAAEAGAEQSTVRRRPERRTAAAKQEAVLELLSGRASVDQLAREYGVYPETVEEWRAALVGLEKALAAGDGRSCAPTWRPSLELRPGYPMGSSSAAITGPSSPAAVERPTGNAVAERLLPTKEECIWLRDWRSLTEFEEAPREWLRIYNEQRPHQALGWAAPAERRAERLSVLEAAA